MSLLRALWGLLDARQRRSFAALCLLSVLMAVATVAGMAGVLPFFTVLADPGAVSHHPALRVLQEHAGGRHFVAVLGVGFALVVVLTSAINLLGTHAMARFAMRVGDTLHEALFTEYLHQGYAFHLGTSSARLTSRVIFETARVTAGILQQGLMLLSSLMLSAAILVSMLLLDARVAIGALGGLALCYAAAYAAARARVAANGRAESRAHEERIRLVNEGFGGIKEVLLAQAQDGFVRRFAASCRTISRTQLSTQAISQVPRHLLEGASACVLAGVALYLAGRPQGAAPWIAQLGFMGLAVFRLLPALQQLFAAMVRVRAERPTFEALRADLARARHAVRTPIPASPWRRRAAEIRCRGLTFRHEADAAPAVAGLDLHLPAGRIVGLIGANGSGKSTVLDLLSGLLVPEAGSITIDGIPLDERNRAAWRARIAYVPQQIFLLDASVYENVAFGVPPEQIDRARVHAALELAQLTGVIDALPHGPQQRLGERGALLSGGQRQRLGIARAVYRAAPLLLLDEATSALDATAEREIIAALIADAARLGSTVVLAAHRLGCLRPCELICELSGGRLIRHLSFAQLAAESQQRETPRITA